MSTKVPSVRPRDTRRNGPKYAGAGGMKPPQKWTSEEDELLRTAVNEIGAKHWKLVAERVPGRNHVQCLQRYLRVLQPGLKKGHWTPEEDEKLRSLATLGFTSWIEAAEQIPGRSAKQCRDRWRNHLESSIKHGPWEPEEDARLLELHAIHGNRWAAIARLIPGRTENAVKIHCKSLLARRNGTESNQSTTSGSNPPSPSGSENVNNARKALPKVRTSEIDDDAEETMDDSSTSPLPSPMGFHSQWLHHPWVSPTNASVVARARQISFAQNGFPVHSVPHLQTHHSNQVGKSLPPQQAAAIQHASNAGVIQANHLQSFPPQLMASNVMLRRNSYTNPQSLASLSTGQHPQLPPQPASSASLAARRHLFPLDTSAPVVFDPHTLFEHISPMNSPSNSTFQISPSGSFTPVTIHSFNGTGPLNLRLDIPAVMRPSGSEAVGERVYFNSGEA